MVVKKSIQIFFIILGFKAYGQQPIMPEQFRVNLPGKQTSENLDFFQLKYSDTTIDLKSILFKYPEIPKSVTINPPDLSGFDHVIVLIGVDAQYPNFPIIWLAGNYHYEEVTFFMDLNQDRNFLNDGEPIVMRAGKAPKRVIMKPEKSVERVLTLRVPKIEVKAPERFKIPIMNRFAVGFNAAVGSGTIVYSYDDLTIGYPTWYDVKITEKSFALSTSYNTRYFNIGMSASFQNLYFFTSHLNVRRGEPFFETRIDGTRRLNDNVFTENNRDSHSNNRLQWSVFTALRIKLAQLIELQPTFRAGMATYFKPEYNRMIHVEGQVYPLNPSPFYQIGLRAEFTVGEHKAMFVEVARNDQKWEPVGFLDDTPHENFQSESVVWKLSVGYRFAFTGK